MPLHVAIAACDLFGAVATLGRTPNLKTLTDDEWRCAGAPGFNILNSGKPAVDTFLHGLQASYPYRGTGKEGPQAVFGRIYQVNSGGRNALTTRCAPWSATSSGPAFPLAR